MARPPADRQRTRPTEPDFRLLAESIPHIVWIATPDGSTAYFNRHGIEYTGLPPDANYGWEWVSLVDPDDLDRARRGWEHSIETSTPFAMEYRIRRADGLFRWHAFRTQPIRGADGKIEAWIGTATDVEDQKLLETELRRAEHEAAESLTVLETLLSTAPIGFGFVDRDFRIIRLNETLAAVHGAPLEEQRGRTVAEVVPDIWAQVERVYRRALAGEATVNLEVSGKTATDPDAVRHWLASYYPVVLDGAIVGIGIVVVDVTDRVRADDERAMLAGAIDQSAEAVMITDGDARITYVNDAFERMSGYASAEVIGRNPRMLKSGAHSATFYDAMWATIEKGMPWVADMTNRRKDGSLYHLASMITPMRAADGSISGFVALGRDMSHERELETLTEHLTRERALIADTLRSIPSSQTLEATTEVFCRQVGRLTDVVVVALVTFDADGSAIPLAYVASDRGEVGLRPQTPERSRYLSEHAAAGPWVEAWVGDPSDPYADSLQRAAVRAFAYAPVLFDGSVIGILAVGSAEKDAVTQLSGQLGAILDFADLAGALIGQRVGDRRVARQVRLDIEAIIADRAFAPVFQPIVDLANSRTVGNEALTRFADGVAPDVRFADAAAVGIGIDLELATLEASLTAATALSPSRWLHLNVSPGFVLERTHLRRLLGGTTARVVLDVTEHAAIDDYGAFRDALASMGRRVGLAVDDAGAGFASMSNILELRPGFVKLDVSLIRGIDADLSKQALVAGMRFFARNTGTRLIAEGVETEAEATTLNTLEIRLAQGYLFGRPGALTART